MYKYICIVIDYDLKKNKIKCHSRKFPLVN